MDVIQEAGGATLPFSDVKLLIGIPSRDDRCFIEFATSLLKSGKSFMDKGGTLSVEKSLNSSFVCLSRNHLVKMLMEGDYTHLLMIDDDMSWNPEAIDEMLLADKDVIAGAGPLKIPDPKFAVIGVTDFYSKIVECTHIGGAFMMLKRSVIEKMIKAYSETYYSEYDKCHHFFRMEIRRDKMITEDFRFCELWRATGGKVWCYTDVTFGHLGQKEYQGNYRQALDKSIK